MVKTDSFSFLKRALPTGPKNPQTTNPSAKPTSQKENVQTINQARNPQPRQATEDSSSSEESDSSSSEESSKITLPQLKDKEEGCSGGGFFSHNNEIRQQFLHQKQAQKLEYVIKENQGLREQISDLKVTLEINKQMLKSLESSTTVEYGQSGQHPINISDGSDQKLEQYRKREEILSK